MKLYFNYTQNFILADYEGEVIDMRTGQPSEAGEAVSMANPVHSTSSPK